MKGGYIVKVNGEEVNNDVWVTTLDYTNVDRFTVAKFNGKLVSYSIDDAPI